MSDIVPYKQHGDRFLEPLKQAAKFTEGISRHHRPSFDNYEIAKAHVFQALGDIHGVEGLRLFGKEVCVAVFCRPNVLRLDKDKVLYLPIKEQKEDWWQHKVALIVATGPSAFKGDDSYMEAQFGEYGPPKIGDWVFCNASNGIAVNLCGENASRPQGLDGLGRTIDIYEWDGWPCRIISDDQFLGMIGLPHQIV